jgi:hypothetical protein
MFIRNTDSDLPDYMLSVLDIVAWGLNGIYMEKTETAVYGTAL